MTTAIATQKHRYIGKYVLVRTYAAGVHIGILDEYSSLTREAFIKETRRIWSWEGAFTLSAIADTGITGGKLAVTLPELMVTQVEELIPCSEAAEKCLREWPTWIIESHKKEAKENPKKVKAEAADTAEADAAEPA